MNDKKRPAMSPIQSEKNKESRNNGTSPSWAAVASGSSPRNGEDQNHRRPSPSRSTASDASRWPVQQRRQQQRTTTVLPIEENHLLTTEGPMRNNFTVEVLKMNGKEIRSQISGKFGVVQIYLKALGLDKDDLEAVIPKYRGNPTIIFKLKKVINIDEVFKGRANFSFLRRSKTEDGTEKVDTYDCVIRGVREEGQTSSSSQRYTYIKVEGADLQVEPKTIKKWLMQYGTLMSDLVQETEELGMSSEEEDFDLDPGLTWTTGTYSVKMLLQRPIHQFLPIDGKKIKIYHRGINKMCSNCYQTGHLRTACQRDRVDWMSYVDSFVLNSGLDETYFGKWMEKLQNWRETMDDSHERNVRQSELNRKRKEEMADKRKEAVGEINNILQAQKQQGSLVDTRIEHEDPPSENEEHPDPPRSENVPQASRVVEKEKQEKKKPTKQKQPEQDETDLLQEAFLSLTVEQLNGLLKAKSVRAGRKSKADAKEEEELRKALAKKMAGNQNTNKDE